MKRQSAGLNGETHTHPGGRFPGPRRSSLDRWHPQRPFYVLRLAILEPTDIKAIPSTVSASIAPRKRSGNSDGSAGLWL